MADERFSLKGWKFKEWVVRNKDSLKLIVAGATGLAVAAVSQLSPVWATALGSIVAAVAKMLVDGIDYWQSE